MINVVHLTFAHSRNDIRIYKKMCVSLAKDGYSVSLIVADNLEDHETELCSIYDVGRRHGGRLYRMILTVRSVFEKAVELDAEIYHLHDPELIPIGLKLKKLGKVVIFDAHEDLPKQLLSKPYLNKFSSVVLSFIFTIFEKHFCRKFDAIVTATPSIEKKFSAINKNSVAINNYPIKNKIKDVIQIEGKTNSVVYVGAISSIRGVNELVSAMNHTSGIKLDLIGSFNESSVREKIIENLGWRNVREHGFLNSDDAELIMRHAKVGVVTFLPNENHINSQPNKLFEYMSLGLPVVASDFPLWKEIIEGYKCGLCVNPSDPEAIAEAVMRLINDDLLAEGMGRNGMHAIQNVFNWESEESKLLKLYARLSFKFKI